jgi:hypothetical protein
MNIKKRKKKPAHITKLVLKHIHHIWFLIDDNIVTAALFIYILKLLF